MMTYLFIFHLLIFTSNRSCDYILMYLQWTADSSVYSKSEATVKPRNWDNFSTGIY